MDIQHLHYIPSLRDQTTVKGFYDRDLLPLSSPWLSAPVKNSSDYVLYAFIHDRGAFVGLWEYTNDQIELLRYVYYL